jgi:DNA-binding MarR family transcriptional regulator
VDATPLIVGVVVGASAALVGRFLYDRLRTGRPKAAEGEDLAPPPVSSAPPSPASPKPAQPVAPEPPRAGRPSRPATLRASEAVILHLYRSGRLDSRDVAPASFSQAGMGAALDVSQSALTKTLGRLRAAGVVTEHRQHVQGQARRLKVYRLTPLGESLARNLYERARRREPNDSRGGPE